MNYFSRAFTMIEMMVVIVLIGMMATIILPRMIRRSPTTDWPQVLDEVNNLVSFARQEAISTQKIYRLRFKSDPAKRDFVVVEEEKDHPEKRDVKIYEQASSFYVETKYEFAEFIRLDAVYRGKKDLMRENKNEGYCFVVPDGLVEDVIIHLTRTYQGDSSKVSFKMLPFLGVFELHDKHIKPEK